MEDRFFTQHQLDVFYAFCDKHGLQFESLLEERSALEQYFMCKEDGEVYNTMEMCND